MKKTTSLIILLLFLSLCYFYQKGFTTNERKDPTSESSSTFATPTYENIESSDTYVEKKGVFTYNNQKIQYLLIFPAKYTQTTTQWPMILFLHGSSLRGQDLNLVKQYGPT